MSDTKNKVDLSKNDELIKKESAFVDLLSMEINKKIICLFNGIILAFFFNISIKIQILTSEEIKVKFHIFFESKISF